MFELIYNILLMPLVMICEFVFLVSYSILKKYFATFQDFTFIGIFIVSVAINILSLPLYIAAENLQNEERIKQKQMHSITSHINNTFKGDERFLVLNAYYKLEGYNPIMQLRLAIPLLLQIPFFSSAYLFFSNSSLFNGVQISFFPIIKDLSKPDMILSINDASLNLLPILMTIINLISAYIYTKEWSYKDKIQPIFLAILFLVILYNSPSALVIYWTFNNIFSLIKIIAIKFKQNAHNNSRISSTSNKESSTFLTKNKLLAIISLFTIFIFLGLFIPSNVISSSPNEFVISTPYNILKFTFTVFLGYFLWGLLYVKMIPDKFDKILSAMFFAICIYFVFNHFIFLNNNGTLNNVRIILNFEIEFC